MAAQEKTPAKLLADQAMVDSGKELTSMMVDFGVGVSKVASYDVKRLDSDYFEE